MREAEERLYVSLDECLVHQDAMQKEIAFLKEISRQIIEAGAGPIGLGERSINGPN